MERIETTIDVDCPIRAVYDQWTQFEEFPRFMSFVKQVRQLDDTHVEWRAELWGKYKEWKAEITEQEPDKRISWRSISGARSAGTVRFEALGPQRTRVRLVMAYAPDGLIEDIGDATGLFGERLEHAMQEFKRFMERRGTETGAWRGEIHHGRVMDMNGDSTPEARRN
jgi:uncharacterized membrane protein